MANRRIMLDGNIKQRGLFDIDENMSIKEIIDTYGGGLKNKSRIKLIQIGGLLGLCITKKDINTALEKYVSNNMQNVIMVMDENICAVDFSLFCIQHSRRELLIKNKSIENIEFKLKKIADGNGELKDVKEIIKVCNEESKAVAVARIKALILFLIHNFREEFYIHIEEKHCPLGACRKLIDANCINACPSNVHVPGYIALMKEGRVKEAYRLMKQRNPFPFICGKICPRPCESKCRRGQIEKTVGVRALKRYVSDFVLEKSNFKETKMLAKSKKIAIVGAGPAGLTAAYYLAKTGYKVVVYEGSKVVGGMLAMGIPSFRLPQTSINKEVCALKELGVVIKTNTAIGKDIGLQQLRKDFDAVLLATGCHIGNRFGPKLKSIEPAINLLREVKTEERSKIGKHVLVIGGGDVAIDAARIAVRLGAEKVLIAALESYEKMPASEEEKLEATEEGVEFINSYGYKALDVDGKILNGIILKRCISFLDENDKFSPIYSEEDTINLEVDHIVLAIGQKPDLEYLNQDIEITKQGWISVNARTYRTSADRVYAAGDVCKPGIAIKAIAEGRKVAKTIDRDLGGTGLYVGEQIDIPEQQLHYGIWDIEKNKEQEVAPNIRICGFEEVTDTLTATKARKEADRCMRCDRNSKG